MSGAQEGVNIEHLLMNIPLPEDLLPSAEEIAGAKAAAAAAHSTCSAALPSQPVKGLGGAGLNLKRKGGSKAGNSSTISAATAPPALLGRPAGGRGAGISNLAGKAGTGAAASGPAAAAAAAAAAETEAAIGTEEGSGADRPQASLSGVATPEGGRSLGRDAAGVRSFRTVLTPGTDEEGSDWETDSQEEIKAAPSQAAKASGGSTGKASWGSSISSLLEDFADPSTLAFCGVVLGACTATLLVLGANAWLKARK